jgi:hypothetical protein
MRINLFLGFLKFDVAIHVWEIHTPPNSTNFASNMGIGKRCWRRGTAFVWTWNSTRWRQICRCNGRWRMRRRWLGARISLRSDWCTPRIIIGNRCITDTRVPVVAPTQALNHIKASTTLWKRIREVLLVLLILD